MDMRATRIGVGAICFGVALGCDRGGATDRQQDMPRPVGPSGAAERQVSPPSGHAAAAPDLAVSTSVGALEIVALFDGAMPTGVTVSQGGRIFVNFPRWGDDVPFSVAEVSGGTIAPYPDDDINRAPPPDHLASGFVSVQSVVVDPLDRLWVLDTGAIKMGPTELGGPKLVAIDLATGHVVKTLVFPRNVALPTSYVNDVRFDLRRGKGGFAYVTDSAAKGPNGIVVVDLDSGRSWRKLNDHPTTRPDPSFLATVEGSPLVQYADGQPPRPFRGGADGIAISSDGRTLYYCPLGSRHLYSVSTDALADEAAPDAVVARSVVDLGEKGASDGLESDAEGRVYVTDYEANAILRRTTDGRLETLVVDPRVLWPDTLSLANDGYLYFTANQLERQAQFHNGSDLRRKPYVLFRTKVDGTRISLRR
jgi:sugar lactone lactonase YvrE